MLGREEGAAVSAVEATDDNSREEGGISWADRDRKDVIDWFEVAEALRPDGRPRFRGDPPEGVCC